jgi:hypothetical protein
VIGDLLPDELPPAPSDATLAALAAETVSAFEADLIARREVAYPAPEHLRHDAAMPANHVGQVTDLGPAARRAREAERNLYVERTLSSPGRTDDDREAVWDTPSPLARHADLPRFPAERLPTWIADFVLAESEATQTPVDMAAMFVLAALGTVAAGRVQVEPEPGWQEGLNLFIAVAMEPGSRKSAVHRDVIAPIVAYEKLLVDQAAPDIAEQASIRRIAEQALAKAERAAAVAKNSETRLAAEADARRLAEALDRLDVPAPPRLFTSDVTAEKLASLLFENGGRIAVLSAEGGIFDLMAGRYSAGVTNIDVYLQGHAGDPIRVDRRGRPTEFVDRPALTVGLAIQPYVLSKIGRVADFRGRGLLDRFVYSIPLGNVGYRRTVTTPVPAPVRSRYDSSIRALAAWCDQYADPVTLQLSPQATALFRGFRDQLEPRRRPDADLGHIQGWSSKLDGAVARVAGLLQLAKAVDLEDRSQWDQRVSEETMATAIAMGQYFVEHALAAYDVMAADPALDEARHVLHWIHKGRLITFTKRECFNANRSRFARATDLDPILRILEDHGFIRPAPTSEPQVGRPSRRFDVNPKAHAQYPQ